MAKTLLVKKNETFLQGVDDASMQGELQGFKRW